jgi:hypothetical protein
MTAALGALHEGQRAEGRATQLPKPGAWWCFESIKNGRLAAIYHVAAHATQCRSSHPKPVLCMC